MFRRFFYPTAFVTICVIAVISWTAITSARSIWEMSADDKLKTSIASVLSHEGELTPLALLRLRRQVQLDILVYDVQGRAVLSTLGKDTNVAYAKLIPERTLEEIFSRGMYIGSINEANLVPSRQIFTLLSLGDRQNSILSLLIPEDLPRDMTHRMIWVIGVTAASGFLFLWAAVYNIARWVVDPLEDLTRAFSRFSAGETEVSLPVVKVPEIALLMDRFREMTREIRKYQRKIQETERLATAGVVAAGLAHEIRNPLTSLKLAGQMLEQSLEGRPAERSRAEIIVREASRLDRIVNDFLGRVKGELKLAPCDLNALVLSVAEAVQPDADARGIEIGLELGGDMREISADAEKIEQILWNLSRNALEAMGKGGRILFRTMNKVGDMVCVQVDDEGPGLEEKALREVFRPFFTTKGEGLGLGLSLCSQIARRHGGDLTLTNRREGGARAELCLPARRPGVSGDGARDA